AGPDGLDALERRQVGGHVAVRWADDLRRSLHEVVAGEQGALLVEEVAEVVGRVARRVDGGEEELGRLDDVADGQRAVEPDLALAVPGPEPEHRGARPLAEAGRAGRVVLVG